MFDAAEIENRTAVAMKPRPDLPFYDVVQGGFGGSDGDRYRHRVMTIQAQNRSISQEFRLAA
jgi:hypothetical protein